MSFVAVDEIEQTYGVSPNRHVDDEGVIVEDSLLNRSGTVAVGQTPRESGRLVRLIIDVVDARHETGHRGRMYGGQHFGDIQLSQQHALCYKDLRPSNSTSRDESDSTKAPRGGDDGDRTHDLRLAKPALYQLSYIPDDSPLY